jgi:hypothetical protein
MRLLFAVMHEPNLERFKFEYQLSEDSKLYRTTYKLRTIFKTIKTSKPDQASSFKKHLVSENFLEKDAEEMWDSAFNKRCHVDLGLPNILG